MHDRDSRFKFLFDSLDVIERLEEEPAVKGQRPVPALLVCVDRTIKCLTHGKQCVQRSLLENGILPELDCGDDLFVRCPRVIDHPDLPQKIEYVLMTACDDLTVALNFQLRHSSLSFVCSEGRFLCSPAKGSALWYSRTSPADPSACILSRPLQLRSPVRDA